MNKVFKTEGETIPTFSEKPLTCLGKFFHDTFKDGQDVKGTHRDGRIDKDRSPVIMLRSTQCIAYILLALHGA